MQAKEGSISYGITSHPILNPLVYWDPWKIENILVNLVTNAERSYEAINDHRKKKIQIKSYNQKEYIVIEVIDNGCGMEEAKQGEIFKDSVSFFHGGKGLGLSIAREYANLHDGSLSVELSKVNVGTTFKLELPSNGEKA